MWVRNDLNVHICLLTIMYDMTITYRDLIGTEDKVYRNMSM